MSLWTNRLQESDRPQRDAAFAATKRGPAMLVAFARKHIFKSSLRAAPAVIPSQFSRETSES